MSSLISQLVSDLSERFVIPRLGFLCIEEALHPVPDKDY